MRLTHCSQVLFVFSTGPPEIPAPYQVPVTERDPETTAIHPSDQV